MKTKPITHSKRDLNLFKGLSGLKKRNLFLTGIICALIFACAPAPTINEIVELINGGEVAKAENLTKKLDEDSKEYACLLIGSYYWSINDMDKTKNYFEKTDVIHKAKEIYDFLFINIYVIYEEPISELFLEMLENIEIHKGSYFLEIALSWVVEISTQRNVKLLSSSMSFSVMKEDVDKNNSISKLILDIM